MAYQKMTVYKSWIIDHLPNDIPAEMLQQALNFDDYYQNGLIIATPRERSNEMDIQYTAHNEQELQLYQFKTVCDRIAYAMELAARKKKVRLWRYERVDVVDGHWRYRENKRYRYNEIFDSRLDWYERYLKLLHPVVTDADWTAEIREKEQHMNHWFHEPHWAMIRNSFALSKSATHRNATAPVKQKSDRILSFGMVYSGGIDTISYAA